MQCDKQTPVLLYSFMLLYMEESVHVKHSKKCGVRFNITFKKKNFKHLCTLTHCIYVVFFFFLLWVIIIIIIDILLSHTRNVYSVNIYYYY